MPNLSIFSKTNDESPSSSVDKFLASKGVGAGRLIFALDATGSRQPTWDKAASLQGEMFREVGAIGRLDLQLVYYRGDECKASGWLSNALELDRLMRKIVCLSGMTQIAKALTHAVKETSEKKVGALVFVGDAMEESSDVLVGKAHELGRLGTPAFMFQEGENPVAEVAFREIARASGGAYGRFDSNGAKQLADLLRAAAVVATGGVAALAARQDEASKLLLGQMRRT
jgi:hypothetical protein